MLTKLKKEDFDADAKRTFDLLRAELPSFRPELENLRWDAGWWTLSLPIPRDADYRFCLHGEIGGERQISAETLIRRKVKAFWYGPLELADFRSDPVALENRFLELVRNVCRFPTRIKEKRGVIWLSFRCEFYDGNAWHQIGPHMMNLGLGLGIPFYGHRYLYQSPSVNNAE